MKIAKEILRLLSTLLSALICLTWFPTTALSWQTRLIDDQVSLGERIQMVNHPLTGNPCVAYYTQSPTIDLMYAESQSNGANWNIEVVRVEASHCVDWQVSLAFNPCNGEPSIAYFDGTYDPSGTDGYITYAYHENKVWHHEQVGYVGDMNVYFFLAVDCNCTPWIAYADLDTDTVKVACRKATDNWVVGIVDSPAGWSSLAINPQTCRPCLAYAKATTSVPQCGNLIYACPDASFILDDPSTWVWNKDIVDPQCYEDGAEISLVFNPQTNQPAIAYLAGDVGNNDLKYAYKDGVNWIIETVDDRGHIRSPISLAFNPINYAPAVCYNIFDPPSGLIYAHRYGGEWMKQTAFPLSSPFAKSLTFSKGGVPRIAHDYHGLAYTTRAAMSWIPLLLLDD